MDSIHRPTPSDPDRTADSSANAPQEPGCCQESPEARRQWLQRYYGEVLRRSEDLATDACCAVGTPPPLVATALENVHSTVQERFYGCGFPIPEALEGTTVLDLGCGAGRDVYVLAQLVGRHGHVIGVDMTPAQLAVARATLAWHMERFGYEIPNVAFHEGHIEDLAAIPIPDASVDVVVSNCVVNLSPAQDRVLAEAARVLRPGGEFLLADVVADRRLPAELSGDPLLQAECLGGAPYRRDLFARARRCGFADPRVVAESPIAVRGAEARQRVGPARFQSLTLRLFKLDGMDEGAEDYGQRATYRGGLPGAEQRFALDEGHVFEAGRPQRVCGNTARMLEATRLAPWFAVEGDRSAHRGAFRAHTARAIEAAPSGTGCCAP